MWQAIAGRSTTPLTYLALVVVWEAFVRAFNIPGWILPSPSAIAATAVTWAPELFFHSLATLRETLIGFVLALVFSLPLAVVIAFTTTLRRLLYPILLGLQSVPKVALAPLVILWRMNPLKIERVIGHGRSPSGRDARARGRGQPLARANRGIAVPVLV